MKSLQGAYCLASTRREGISQGCEYQEVGVILGAGYILGRTQKHGAGRAGGKAVAVGYVKLER